MTARTLAWLTIAGVVGLVVFGGLAVGRRIDAHAYRQVETTTDTTPSTTWLETQPHLGDGFDELLAGVARAKAAHRPRRMKASDRPMPGGAPYPTDELLLALARCETGGTMDQRATSKSGRYLSFFQWAIETWHSIGGTGDPRDHPYHVQAPLARALILRSGWGQFPTCSRVIGAR